MTNKCFFSDEPTIWNEGYYYKDNKCFLDQKIHEEYGGVVPELASRAHQQNIVPVVDQALKKAGITKDQGNKIE